LHENASICEKKGLEVGNREVMGERCEKMDKNKNPPRRYDVRDEWDKIRGATLVRQIQGNKKPS